MRKRFALGERIGLAFGLGSVGLIALVSLIGGGAARAAVTTVSDVSAIDSAFNPQVVTITVGSSVRWTNTGSVLHTATSDTGLWDSGDLSPGGAFTQTFSAAGVYPYYCVYHGLPGGIGMAGSVVVVTSTLSVCPTCPYTTIGSALADATTGDVVRVASGTYTERLTITETVTLEGGWDASFTMRVPGDSVVDAQRLGRVLTILGPVSPTIDGFTITGGDATTEISGTHRGGGVYIEKGGALLVNNIITNNMATTHITETGFGGGVHVAAGRVVISANQILSNVAGAGGPNTQAYGGGVYADGTPILINNLVASNQARTGGAMFGYGGGAWVSNGVIRGNRFMSNSASNGGGIAGVINTIFEGNLSRGTTGGNFLVEAGGAGSRLTNNYLLETNCPTGMYPGNSAIQVVNNTIVGCLQGIYVPLGASPPISNNLFYSNATAIAGEGTPLLDYNGFWLNGTNFNVSSTLTGTHNVFADPLFVDPASGDYHLRPGSRMIDAGTGAGAPPTDYDGDPRPIGGSIDIGADEVAVKTFLPLVLKLFGP